MWKAGSPSGLPWYRSMLVETRCEPVSHSPPRSPSLTWSPTSPRAFSLVHLSRAADGLFPMNLLIMAPRAMALKDENHSFLTPSQKVPTGQANQWSSQAREVTAPGYCTEYALSLKDRQAWTLAQCLGGVDQMAPGPLGLPEDLDQHRPCGWPQPRVVYFPLTSRLAPDKGI